MHVSAWVKKNNLDYTHACINKYMIVHKHLLYLLVSNYRYKGGVVSVGQDGNNMYTRIINFFLIIARQKGFFSGAHLEYTVSIAISLRQLYMQSLDSKLHAWQLQCIRSKYLGPSMQEKIPEYV